MCLRLTAQCNRRAQPSTNALPFPTATQVDAISVSVLEKDCRLGYRAAYLKNIARKFIECRSFADWAIEDILACLSEVKGVGEYSINHLAMLLGKWDRIPVDSEVRSYVRQAGRPDDSESIHAH